jgi:hypothetical protein
LPGSHFAAEYLKTGKEVDPFSIGHGVLPVGVSGRTKLQAGR